MAEEERYLSPRGARISAKLTIVEAAKELDVTKYQLQSYESGRTPLPLEVAWKMKEAYRLPSIVVLKP